MLEEPHHPAGGLIEKIATLGIDPAVGAVKTVEVFDARRRRFRKEAEETAAFPFLRLCRYGGQAETIREQLRDVIDVARVLVVIAHESFASAKDILLRVAQTIGEHELLAKYNDIGRTLVEVMQFRADAQQKVVSSIQGAALLFIEQLLLDEPCSGLHPFLEERDPEQ